MLKKIDDLLNQITIYRLTLYYLIGLLLTTVILSFFKVLSYNPFFVIYSALFLVVVSYLTNKIFAKVFKAQPNAESAYITALILALIITPLRSLPDDLPFLFWAATMAMASKYILALNKKHLFNPAAIAVAITAFTTGQSATWWVGSLTLVPFVLLGGILVVRKLRRLNLVLGFLITATLIAFLLGLPGSLTIVPFLQNLFLNSALLFFAFVMLTEPLTTPPTSKLQILYGTLVGVTFAPQVHLGPIYSTPELALITGNLFSYVVSPKRKYVLKLIDKVKLGGSTYDFRFKADHHPSFTPGQYLEWTLPHSEVDSRGNRRYFTIASSPTENNVTLGVKFYERSSSYKRALLSLKVGDTVIAGSLTGDFTLPRDPTKKLAFMAGGIGITPFRSMLKYLIDSNEKRNVVILVVNKNYQDLIYQDVLTEAEDKLGAKVDYFLTETTEIPSFWGGQMGRVTAKSLQNEIPDFASRLFYISGPRSFVTASEALLKEMRLPKSQIKTDFFPGFA